MRQSKLFTKTRKEAPKDETAQNAKLLIRGGFIHKEMAGAYSYLPLGLRVLEKIVGIIREEMNAIGGQEISMTALQDKKIWDKTNRWSDEVVDNWFKTKLKSGSDVGLGFTHEEPLTALMKEYVQSYKDLPAYVYQFQTKFRNEERAKSGIMRTREFLMKDLYSFSLNEKSHTEFYEKAKKAYVKIFERVGLGEKTFITFASGGSFSKYSHEFQTLSDAGEDTIYVNENPSTSLKAGKIAINKEVFNDEVLKELGLIKKDLVEKKAIEIGNIFSLGTRFSDAFDLTYLDEKGQKNKVIMGSYGIGPGRVMGTIVETLSDDKGIVWPESVAPFTVHLISIAGKDGKTISEADKLYEKLSKAGVEVLYDDRDARAGEKFADADLIGIPVRIVISDKTLEKGKVEWKRRNEEKTELVELEKIVSFLSKK